MPVNDTILYTDYNSLRNAIAQILGTGSGNSGYGQTVQSSTVSGALGTGSVQGGGLGANQISTTEYTRLRSDIINVYRHIYGSDPSPAQPNVGQLIRWVVASGAVTTEYGISEYGLAEFNATSIAGTIDPYTQFSTFVNDLTASRFSCAISQSITENKGLVQRTTAWGGGSNTISCRIRINWTTADQARYFFNSGGEVRITASRTGGSVSGQNTSWENLLAAAGQRTFSAQLPSTTLTGTSGQNWYTLGSGYQTWYTTTGSSPYGSNQYRIQARTLDAAVVDNNLGTSQGVDFLVQFQDNYTDPGPPAPGDQVDGTLEISVNLKRARGNLVPEPQTGLFTIESPTVSYFGGSSGSPTTID